MRIGIALLFLVAFVACVTCAEENACPGPSNPPRHLLDFVKDVEAAADGVYEQLDKSKQSLAMTEALILAAEEKADAIRASIHANKTSLDNEASEVFSKASVVEANATAVMEQVENLEKMLANLSGQADSNFIHSRASVSKRFDEEGPFDNRTTMCRAAELIACLSGQSNVACELHGFDFRLRRTVTTVFGTCGTAGSSSTTLENPNGIFLTKDNELLIADSSNFRYLRVAADGSSTTIATLVHSNSPYATDIVAAEDGTMYYVDYRNHKVWRHPAGSTTATVFATGANPIGIIIASDGDVVVAFNQDHCVKKYPPATSGTPTGTVIAGTCGTSGTSISSLNFPGSVSQTKSGDFLISDQLNACVKRATFNNQTNSYTLSAAAGSCTGSSASLAALGNNLVKYALELSNGDILVAAFGDECIKRYHTDGRVTAAVGQCGQVETGGDFKVKEAYGLLISGEGDLLWSDGNDCVRRIKNFDK